MEWPPKVRSDFPLTVAPRGYMARIAGKPRWICGKKTPAEALKIYHRKCIELARDGGGEADKPLPTPQQEEPDLATVHYILGRWLLARRQDCIDGGIKAHTYRQYFRSAKRIDKIIGHFACADLTPEHTEQVHKRITKADGADAARRAMQHLRDCCSYAAERRWCRPVHLGEKMVRKLAARPVAEMKWRLYTPAEIRKILNAAQAKIGATKDKPTFRSQNEQLYAMILLALNGGYGGQELSDLKKSDVDQKRGVIDAVRAKTGIRHTVPLWPETLRALKPVLAQRPDDALLFRTRQGNPWVSRKPSIDGKNLGVGGNDNVSERFNELVGGLGLKVPGQSFYKLRHLAQTTADAANDPHATYALYGHALPGVKSHYVKVDESRVRAVVEYVRKKLLH